MQCDDPEFIKLRNAMLSFANQFHRVKECGVLEPVAAPKESTDNAQKEELT
jgi:hypothetical protein